MWGRFIKRIDNFNIKNKLQILFVVCVLIPLILSDSIIINMIVSSEAISRKHNMENVASAVSYNFSNRVNNLATNCKRLYTNKTIEHFLEKEYESNYSYIKNYQNFEKNVQIQGEGTVIKFYADNDTIIDGGIFGKISGIRNMEWYQYLRNSKLDTVLYFYYEDGKSIPKSLEKRKIVLLQKLNYYPNHKEKILKYEIDYNSIIKSMVKMNYGMPVYICQNNYVIVSNDQQNGVVEGYGKFLKQDRVGFTKKISLYGQDFDIFVIKPEDKAISVIKNHLLLVILLIIGNVILPLIFMKAINESFVIRLKELSCVFKRVEDDHLINISNARGKDEIGSLMRNYNKMANRTNQLIQTVYVNKLKEQEMNIAKQKAELLALHSQINPHFLFNALESIRMHSVLKEEFETANMVEKLASMARQNVEWFEDSVEISKEIGFVETYLSLQKYRFGDRLSYELDIDEACAKYLIPKLTIVTLVENACVHGVERKKGSSWIFVRAYLESDMLCMEIEDTGCGMNELLIDELKNKLENASIEMLEEKGRVGMINACLRLKMATEGKVHFDIDSEEGVGTIIQIRIPISKMVQQKEGDYA